jgi:benzoyl-CoA 2,3-dioxygenase component B
LMREAGFSGDVRKLGGIDIPTIQKHLNQWFSLSLDLHGSEVSSNAASYFANGLKGRAKEDTWEDHLAKDAFYRMEFWEEGRTVTKDIVMRNAMNEVLRDWYVGDCAAGVERWNRILDRYGMSERLRLPDRKFNRRIGMYGGFHFDPNGVALSTEEWERCRYEWLPSQKDSEYLLSIMASPVYEPGKFANYIAPPRRGINQKPIDFEYVRTET